MTSGPQGEVESASVTVVFAVRQEKSITGTETQREVRRVSQSGLHAPRTPRCGHVTKPPLLTEFQLGHVLGTSSQGAATFIGVRDLCYSDRGLLRVLDHWTGARPLERLAGVGTLCQTPDARALRALPAHLGGSSQACEVLLCSRGTITSLSMCTPNCLPHPQTMVLHRIIKHSPRSTLLCLQ